MTDREALWHIIHVLEPLGWKCPDHSCRGCEYEAWEALLTAMDAVSGVTSEERWNSRPSWRIENGDRSKRTVLIDEETAARFAAVCDEKWRAAGFYQDDKGMWRPPMGRA